MSGHLPGPWEIGSDFVGPLKVMTSKDRIVVAHVAAPSFPLAEANARLIAAAPELLDALKALHEQAIDDVDDRRLSEAVVNAEAAIAKAEGRQS